jgi:ABC-type branched-subunit amino acid transport system substrate-binding protein
VGVVGLGLIAAIASAACSSKNDNGGGPTNGTDASAPDASTGADAGNPSEWVIGVSDSLTGGLAGIGTPLQNAVKVAEANINANGGILGKKVRFVIEDDTSDEGTIAQQTIGKLLNEGATAIIGPNGSGQVNAVQTITYADKIIEISATATSPVLTTVQPAQDRYLFRTVPADDFQGKALVKFAISGPSGTGVVGTGDAGADGGGTGGAACKKLALFYYTNPYGTAMAKVVKDNFPAASGGGTIVADISVDTTVKGNYDTEAATIAAAKPDCVAMIVYDDVGDAFLSSLRSAIGKTDPTQGWATSWNPNFFVIGTDGTYTQSLITNGRAD